MLVEHKLNEINIGIDIDTDILMESDWDKIYKFSEEEHDELDIVFNRLFMKIKEYYDFLNNKVKILNNKYDEYYSFIFILHLNRFGDLFKQKWFMEEFNAVKQKFQNSICFKIIFHFPISKKMFSNKKFEIKKDYLSTIIEHISILNELEGSHIVIHPPSNLKNINEESEIEKIEEVFTDLFLNEKIRKLLLKTGIILAFENMQDSGSYYQQMSHLLNWRNLLLSKLSILCNSKKEFETLSTQYTFCFDTGHYLLLQQRDGYEDMDILPSKTEFFQYTSVIHLHSNDGSKDHHLLPHIDIVNNKLPEELYPISFKYFFENSHLVYRWVCEIVNYSNLNNLIVIFEISPYFSEKELFNAFEKLLSCFYK